MLLGVSLVSVDGRHMWCAASNESVDMMEMK